MTNDYWKERIKAEQEAKIERDVSLGDEMKRLYDYHFAEIEKEIRAFEQRHADKNGLTLAQVKERVSEMDVKTFEEKAKRYVAEKDFSTKANSELSLYNLKMRMKRLELLQYQMDLEMVALADSEHKMAEKFLNQEYVKELELQAGLLGRSVLSDGAIKQMAQATLNTPFKGATWSSRIWERQDELRYIAAKMTEDLLLKGKNPTDMIPKLRKEFDVSVSEARRLAVTEGARMATEAQKQAFDANGYTEYEFISEPKACDICKPLDGKIFKVKDMEPGKNAAPMHPFCRCSTAAHYSLSDKEYERIIRESAESMGMEYRPPAKPRKTSVNTREQEFQTIDPSSLNAFKQLSGKITQLERTIIYADENPFDLGYIGTGHSFEINKMLREGKKLPKVYQTIVDTLDGVLRKNKSTRNIKAYRFDGAGLMETLMRQNPDLLYENQKSEETLRNLKSGDVNFTNHGFVSTSYDLDKSYFDDREILTTINIPKGYEIYFTDNDEGSEIILPRGTKFDIIKAEQIDNKLYLELTVRKRKRSV